MPIYEYECGKCGVFEVSQRISEAALSKCPTCRRRVRRLISNTSFQLKGSGWYVTDYAGKASKKEAPAGEGPGPDGKEAAAKESSGKETPAKEVKEKKPAKKK